MSVIVTNACSAKALVVTRSLGRKGINVTNTDSERFSPTFFSKYSTDRFLSPSAERSPTEFINTILNYVKKRKIEVLMPINSTETLLISKYKDKFIPYTTVPFEDYRKMMQVHDKNEVMRIASELDLPVPKTDNIENTNGLQKLAKMIEYPAVIKLKNATSSIGVSYAHSEEELISKYRQTIMKYNLTTSDYPIIQEYVPGNGYGVSLLFNHGDLRAIFTHKRLREYPITGGPSTLRESVRHPEMEKIALKLLDHIGWHGVAMVEFKLDKRTNKPVLIEVNPRFWGSINQAIAAGVDFPYLLYKIAVDGDVKPVFNYKVGVRTRFLINDFRALLSRIKTSTNRSQVLKEFFKFRSDDLHYDTISSDDMLPAVVFLYIGAKEFFRSKDR